MIDNLQIQTLVQILKNATGYDFGDYSERSLQRRVDKFLVDNNLDFDDLIREIPNFSEPEIDKLISNIVINTTELFRNPTIWHSIKYRILPKLNKNEAINIWHAGCSTGQEIYSMLILLSELNMLDKVNIYASDINQIALNKAQQAEYIYRFNIEYFQNFDEVVRKNPYNFEEYNDVQYSKYFDIDQVNDRIKVKDFLKNKIIFKKHDLVRKENIFYKKFDLIVCRNVLIYFNQNLQSEILNFFYDNLKFPGYLVLGFHETILGNEAMKYHKKYYYYTKKLI